MVQKVAVSREFEARLRHAATGELFVSPSRKWVPLSNKGRIRQLKDWLVGWLFWA